jgi:SH3-like domain-containing protein
VSNTEQRKIEEERLEAARILEMFIKRSSPDQAAADLAMLVEVPLLSEPVLSNIKRWLEARRAGEGPRLSNIAPNQDGQPCDRSQGDFVVFDIPPDDPDRGLNVRNGPTANSIKIAQIPSNGTGIGVGSCQSGFCNIKYRCLTGWVTARFLAPRSSTFRRVTNPDGLQIWTEQDEKSLAVGKIPPDATDVVVHWCGAEWCQISYANFTGWTIARFLDKQG